MGEKILQEAWSRSFLQSTICLSQDGRLGRGACPDQSAGERQRCSVVPRAKDSGTGRGLTVVHETMRGLRGLVEFQSGQGGNLRLDVPGLDRIA
jgi:hypothetical protein